MQGGFIMAGYGFMFLVSLLFAWYGDAMSTLMFYAFYVVSTIVASRQLSAPATQFAEATAIGSQQAFMLLALMLFVALVMCWVMTVKCTDVN